MDLYTARHALHTTEATDRQPLAAHFGVAAGATLYAVAYRTRSARPACRALDEDAGGRAGWAGMFAAGEEADAPGQPQTERGRGALLSCLYAVTGAVARRPADARLLLRSLARQLPSFPPVQRPPGEPDSASARRARVGEMEKRCTGRRC